MQFGKRSAQVTVMGISNPANEFANCAFGLTSAMKKEHVTEMMQGLSQSIKKVQRDGFRIGTVFDLRTGWNLTRASDRRKLWATLEV